MAYLYFQSSPPPYEYPECNGYAGGAFVFSLAGDLDACNRNQKEHCEKGQVSLPQIGEYIPEFYLKRKQASNPVHVVPVRPGRAPVIRRHMCSDHSMKNEPSKNY